MKTSHRILSLVCIAIWTLLLMSCNSGSGKTKTNSTEKEQQSPSGEEQTVDEESSSSDESIDGLYTYDDDSGMLAIRINGDKWSGKTMIKTGFGEEYDNQNASYDFGVVIGKDLYESSGMVKIGYVEGNSLTTSIGDQLVVLRK